MLDHSLGELTTYQQTDAYKNVGTSFQGLERLGILLGALGLQNERT
jgi:hypothetical protein